MLPFWLNWLAGRYLEIKSIRLIFRFVLICETVNVIPQKGDVFLDEFAFFAVVVVKVTIIIDPYRVTFFGNSEISRTIAVAESAIIPVEVVVVLFQSSNTLIIDGIPSALSRCVFDIRNIMCAVVITILFEQAVEVISLTRSCDGFDESVFILLIRHDFFSQRDRQCLVEVVVCKCVYCTIQIVQDSIVIMRIANEFCTNTGFTNQQLLSLNPHVRVLAVDRDEQLAIQVSVISDFARVTIYSIADNIVSLFIRGSARCGRSSVITLMGTTKAQCAELFRRNFISQIVCIQNKVFCVRDASRLGISFRSGAAHPANFTIFVDKVQLAIRESNCGGRCFILIVVHFADRGRNQIPIFVEEMISIKERIVLDNVRPFAAIIHIVLEVPDVSGFVEPNKPVRVSLATRRKCGSSHGNNHDKCQEDTSESCCKLFHEIT